MKNKLILAIVVAAIIAIGGIAVLRRSDTGDEVITGTFSTDISGLTEAKASETVALKNGESYALTASMVKKKIGNRMVKMLAYNGMIPGPLIKVGQGAEITLSFTNNTDVDTTIHSHGVRLENTFDGVPGVTQKEIKPGESFTYKVKFPDEGMYWYHPHIREDYAQELGLYGNYLVVPNDPSYWPPVNREVALFIDDILIENGKIAGFSKASADHALMGRFGNTMLVNGLPAQAGETNYSLSAKKGEIIRFYMTNSANARTFNISIPGAQVKLVGADGGKYERETWSNSIILSPSERAIVEVLFADTGSYTLQHKTPERTYALGTITVSNEKISTSFEKEFLTLRRNSDIRSDIDPFRPSFDKPADKRLKLTVDMGADMMSRMGGHLVPDGSMMSGMMGSGDPIEWEDDMQTMNAMSNSDMMQWVIRDEDTGKKNMDIDWNFKVGDKVKIKITNEPNSMHQMQHPIHFHGQRFLVLSANGKPNDNLVWKDTALIQNGDTVELLVEITNPGTWMAHCHIAEHLETGMMFGFTVE